MAFHTACVCLSLCKQRALPALPSLVAVHPPTFAPLPGWRAKGALSMNARARPSQPLCAPIDRHAKDAPPLPWAQRGHLRPHPLTQASGNARHAVQPHLYQGAWVCWRLSVDWVLLVGIFAPCGSARVCTRLCSSCCTPSPYPRCPLRFASFHGRLLQPSTRTLETQCKRLACTRMHVRTPTHSLHACTHTPSLPHTHATCRACTAWATPPSPARA